MISMTGFAARRGAGLGYAWVWDLRSVNGKGLDLRLRVPDWIDGLEAAIRADLQKQITRGNVNLTLKISQDEGRDDTAFRLNETGLAAALAAAVVAGLVLGRALLRPFRTSRRWARQRSGSGPERHCVHFRYWTCYWRDRSDETGFARSHLQAQPKRRESRAW